VRLLCDEMLRGLGKWLRAAGYDTMIAEGGLSDRALAALCAAENRVLLTKDRHLAAVAERVARVVLVPGNSIDENARALREMLDIDWRHTPFTRCLIDNTPLEPAPPNLAAQRTAGFARCRRSAALLPRVRPHLLARRSYSANAVAAHRLATRCRATQLR
jgi:uncharacterized protein